MQARDDVVGEDKELGGWRINVRTAVGRTLIGLRQLTSLGGCCGKQPGRGSPRTNCPDDLIRIVRNPLGNLLVLAEPKEGNQGKPRASGMTESLEGTDAGM